MSGKAGRVNDNCQAILTHQRFKSSSSEARGIIFLRLDSFKDQHLLH
jgi:hypothetical protein